jgi:galactosylceramidase
VAAALLIALMTACPALAQNPAVQSLSIDGAAAGKIFEGVGAVSGGGATSVLLKDYPEPQRGQILDLLFKPMFGASMHTLYVEIGGDGNSTQGTEPTHMRSRTDENYARGYEWWLMAEAKKRNPALTLDACAWSAPGWIGNGQFWSQDMADYYVKWIKGLKANYGLDLDAVGCRNERGVVTHWVKLFRKTLDDAGLDKVRIHAFDNPGESKWNWIPELAADPQLAAAVDVISNHTLTIGPQPASVIETADKLGKPIWNTEEHVYGGDGRKYTGDYEHAIGCVNLFNENFISHGATKIVNWYLAGSTYPNEPYFQDPPALFAHSPWSGHYRLKPIFWSYAHYGQFVKIGWTYVASGCAKLGGGGTVVSLKSPEGGDFSVIAETAAAKAPQTLTLRPTGGLAATKPLCVWRTTRDEQFVRQPDLSPAADGTLTITLEPGAIYSISTTTGQQKGVYPDVPADKPFPFPYFDNFDHYIDAKSFGYLPHYTADICGVFEIADRPGEGGGKCLRQAVTQKSQSWAPEWKPYTILGDVNWTDYEISADVLTPDGGWAGVMGRIGATGNGWDGNPNGYYARLYPDGGVALYAANQRLKGSRERELAVGHVEKWQWNRWHNLKLRFEGKTVRVLVDDVEVLKVDDDTFAKGNAGLVAAGEGNARHAVLFDNLRINRANGGDIPPTDFGPGRTPIYAK